MSTNYQIFGIQRSGTNFVETVMRSNFNKTKKNSQRLCWKHTITDPTGLDKAAPTIVIYKNPYTWVESIAFRNTVDWLKTQTKYPAKAPTTPELTIGPSNLNLTNIIKTYRDFYQNWLGREDMSMYYVIKYEDLLNQNIRDVIMEEICQKFWWTKTKKGPWAYPSRGSVSQSKDYSLDREQYYVAGKPEKLTEEHIKEINQILGEDFIRSMGYSIL